MMVSPSSPPGPNKEATEGDNDAVSVIRKSSGTPLSNQYTGSSSLLLAIIYFLTILFYIFVEYF